MPSRSAATIGENAGLDITFTIEEMRRMTTINPSSIPQTACFRPCTNPPLLYSPRPTHPRTIPTSKSRLTAPSTHSRRYNPNTLGNTIREPETNQVRATANNGATQSALVVFLRINFTHFTTAKKASITPITRPTAVAPESAEAKAGRYFGSKKEGKQYITWAGLEVRSQESRSEASAP